MVVEAEEVAAVEVVAIEMTATAAPAKREHTPSNLNFLTQFLAPCLFNEF
jgi:hypothetical protein